MTTHDQTTPTDDAPPATTPSLALERVSPFNKLRELSSHLDVLDAIANALCKSTILPRDMQTPANLKLVLLQGLAMGFDPIQAIRASYIISSKDQPPRVGYYVEALVALVRSSPVCRFFRVEVATVEKCRVVCSRKDEDESVVHVFELTMAQAQAANLDKQWVYVDGKPVPKTKYTWQTAGADMLRNRTCGRAVKTVFQDVVFGMATPDELDDLGAAETLEAAAAREYSPVPLTRPARSSESAVGPADSPKDPARGDVVDAELVDQPGEGSGDRGWDAMLADVGRITKMKTDGWLPDDLLELWATRLQGVSSKGQLTLQAGIMTAVGSHVSSSKSVGEVYARMRGMYNDRDRDLKQAARAEAKAGAQ